ncbi:arsenic resistance protein [Nesterenkonia haasae]|uniref:arsenic resistance protein n=1 Tax=Nesterenkonia haasae TaxID=2587813 RepID=UPI0013914BAE|nr:symporter [Nesterenkonia haasae]NDK31434.1 symporter [Nesterenkonia haasae]
MTSHDVPSRMARPGFAVLLFSAAMLAGLVAAAFVPGAPRLFGEVVDYIIIALVTLLFLDIRFKGAGHLIRAPRTLSAVMGMNFLIIPILAFGLTAVTVPGDSMLRLGVLIYLLFPCTDWFLGFIRVTRGNAALGAALIPINLLIQIALYPLWISLFTGDSLGSVLVVLGPALLYGVGIPVGIAAALRLGLTLVADQGKAEAFRAKAGQPVPWVLAGMIFALFAAYGREYILAPTEFGQVLLAVFCFFLVTYVLIELISRGLKLDYGNYSLLTFTASARNAPLMLAITALAFGEQPALLAAIVLGMLLEFPHLTALTWLLRRRRDRQHRSSQIGVQI